MGTIIHDFEHNLSEAIKLYEQAKEIFEKEIDLDPDSIDDIDNFHTKLKTLLVYYDESNDSDNYQKIELKIKQMESLQAERKKKYLLRIPAPTLCPDLNSN
jgi:tetratricopeptide (TPR) repeat protein